MSFPRPLIAIIVAGLVVIAGVCWYIGRPRYSSGPPPSVESVLPKQFLIALQQQKSGKVVASADKTSRGDDASAAVKAQPTPPSLTGPLTLTAKGLSQLHVSGQNTGDKPASVALHAGDIYEAGQSKIVLLEDCNREIPPRGILQADVRIAPVNFQAVSANDAYKKSATTVPKLDALLARLKTRPDLSKEAAQTAILILAENPPVDAFAKFPRLHDSSAGVSGNSGDFKVDVADIIAALQVLADIGITDRAMGSDPQLEVEAMIDTKAHDIAMRYYGITQDMEWTYWKHELLEGDPGLRHYALYGIAENYPDVALQMLPKWARETRLPAIYRLSAVRAMGVTHRAEAIPILQQLEKEFNPDTDLYKSADHATKYLSAQFNQPS